jgi:hypothetical protein
MGLEIDPAVGDRFGTLPYSHGSPTPNQEAHMTTSLQCLEFQVRVPGTGTWESLIRFVLDEDTTLVVAHGDAATQAGVAAVLNDVYQETLYLPEDGRRFFNAVADWKDGVRQARVVPTRLSRDDALDMTSLHPAGRIQPAGETQVELIGEVQPPVQSPHPLANQSGSVSRP